MFDFPEIDQVIHMELIKLNCSKIIFLTPGLNTLIGTLQCINAISNCNLLSEYVPLAKELRYIVAPAL